MPFQVLPVRDLPMPDVIEWTL
ncbi:hypothetical protein BOSE62_140063 [Bosea sp. 62]|nr:hypothetical protein BOSE7B_150064 [Bosea sp. 7B]CAD5271461.1 hypothetical protein BOSE21B_20004 [Bosea sp. 21B]CAD5273604.1 hypothetical protein BOSE46_20303 [Bosea sp. 46]VVT56165.1 hypothetical protein BOS5A_140004 [Bosea sp. EC-HK365B]VXB63964.1 hypothetical protein BOSE62_140063 [Bosea sp. 62]VXC06220.1 hypothetical protein BOSE29B_20005 [Bosea sp. 29B]VXC29612.1 hypothetical protein BOSE127_180066 [Bosea sp. 127]VXC60847.1 hypothetical protein BOSE125_30320 [Bosea sp. 125]